MERLYRLFGKVTKQGLMTFLFKRLPVYLLGLIILTVWGVKGLMFTFLLITSFFLGWIVNKLVSAFKDYRLTQRLNRIHFTAIEYDTMQRERDLAIAAFQQITEKAAKRVKAAGMPPTPSMPHHRANFDPEAIREYARQHGVEDDL